MSMTSPTPKRPLRIDVNLEAGLTTSDGHRVQVTVRDVSARGLRLGLQQREELVVGEEVRIEVPGKGEYKAIVKWTAGSEAGAVFL